MKYYVIAGEKSGDNHGALLIKAIRTQDAHASFRGVGGEAMRKAGLDCFFEAEKLSVLGVYEVLMRLLSILRIRAAVKRDVLVYQPDRVIFIDFSSFNLSLAEFTHKQKLYNCYYISPKIWAWKTYRAYRIRQVIDCMLCILPFEPAFYKKYDYAAHYVGNPLVNRLSAYTYIPSKSKRKRVALLPGSRRQELQKMIPIFSSLCTHFPDIDFQVAALKHLSKELYAPITQYKNVTIIYENTYELLEQAHAAVVTSGTATLETAMIGTPQLICYRMNFLTYYLVKALVGVKYISLVNLILDQALVREFIQYFALSDMADHLRQLLYDHQLRENIQRGYHKLYKILGTKDASEEAASLIVSAKPHNS